LTDNCLRNRPNRKGIPNEAISQLQAGDCFVSHNNKIKKHANNKSAISDKQKPKPTTEIIRTF